MESAGPKGAPTRAPLTRLTRALASGLPPSRGAILFGAFSLLLLAKLALVRALVLGDAAVLRTLPLEAAFVLAVLGPIELLTERRYLAYVVADAAVSALLIATTLYAAFFGRVLSLDALRFAGQVMEVESSIVEIVRPWEALLLVDVVLLAAALPLVRRREGWWAFGTIDSRVVGVSLLAAIAGAALVWSAATRPDLGSSLSLARRDGLVRYQLSVLFRRRDSGTPAFEVNDPEAVQAAFASVKDSDRDEEPSEVNGIAEGRDLIFVQLESIQRFPLGRTVGGRAVTPNLDALAAQGWSFTRTYSQAGIGNTSDVEFMVNAGLYPSAERTSAERLGTHSFPSLARLLGLDGYQSEAFHANQVSFWGRDTLYVSLGFQAFHDAGYFEGEEVIGLGPSDAVLFRRTLGRLSELARAGRYFAQIITLTPHHPFELPASKRTLPLPAGIGDSIVGRYLETVHYEDACIGEFVDGLKAKGLWERSVLVIYGDHFGLDPKQLSAADRKALKDLLGREYSLTDKFNVPLLVVVPGEKGPGDLDPVLGQVDILPTVADFMGLDLALLPHAGQSAFSRTPNLLAERYHLPGGSFITERVMVVPQTGYDDAISFRLSDGRRVRGTPTVSEAERVSSLLGISDAYVLGIAPPEE